MLRCTGTINHTALPEHKFEDIHVDNMLVSKGSDRQAVDEWLLQRKENPRVKVMIFWQNHLYMLVWPDTERQLKHVHNVVVQYLNGQYIWVMDERSPRRAG